MYLSSNSVVLNQYLIGTIYTIDPIGVKAIIFINRFLFLKKNNFKMKIILNFF